MHGAFLQQMQYNTASSGIEFRALLRLGRSTTLYLQALLVIGFQDTKLQHYKGVVAIYVVMKQLPIHTLQSNIHCLLCKYHLTVCFSLDALQMLSADSAGVLKLWDSGGGTCIQTHDAHEARLWTVAAAPDGRSFLTGGEDGALVVWHDVTQQVRSFLAVVRRDAGTN